MESNFINQEFVESLNTRQLYNYFEKLVHEYNSLDKHRKGLKHKHFTIIQHNIANTFTWDDYHQRIVKYLQEDTEFAQQINKKNQQLEYVSAVLQRRIDNDRYNK
jgi:hypothetical protein